MKYSKEVYEVIASEGWSKKRIARFMRMAERRASKILALSAKEANPNARNQAETFRAVAQGMKDTMAAVEHLLKPVLLIEAIAKEDAKPEGSGGVTINIRPSSQAKFDDD